MDPSGSVGGRSLLASLRASEYTLADSEMLAEIHRPNLFDLVPLAEVARPDRDVGLLVRPAKGGVALGVRGLFTEG